MQQKVLGLALALTAELPRLIRHWLTTTLNSVRVGLHEEHRFHVFVAGQVGSPRGVRSGAAQIRHGHEHWTRAFEATSCGESASRRDLRT